MKLARLGVVCAFAFSLISIPSHARLIDRGGGMVYDTALNITWAQARAQMTMEWEEANNWAAALRLGGVGGWRLPYISATGGAGPFLGNPVDCSVASERDCRDNELGYMFYQYLGGTPGDAIPPNGNPDVLNLFPNTPNVAGPFWSATQDRDNGRAWSFNFNGGTFRSQDQNTLRYAWAVHDGNVEPVDSIAVKVKGSVTKTMVADEGRWGGCMALLDQELADYGLNCPGSWVTFSCSGVYTEKTEAYRMFDQAQMALARKRKIQVYVDDTKKHNDYCFANQVRVFNK